MAHWEIKIPTVTEGQRTGVQVFMYPADRFRVRSEAVKQARADFDSEDAVRHRGGAVAGADAITAVWHDPLI
ncbi:hypothetical protein OHT57_47260 (plasmid) [Streptomyces sp. NBC_00285]|uniref:hypothetical protein n=1 Tax=Streptomyces sp. NBC_00285 TaxID=2975700 RepID=UPI002E2814FC|nr:hypothetical protein [Streptomyces sp. NBC_00285]